MSALRKVVTDLSSYPTTETAVILDGIYHQLRFQGNGEDVVGTTIDGIILDKYSDTNGYSSDARFGTITFPVVRDHNGNAIPYNDQLLVTMGGAYLIMISIYQDPVIPNDARESNRGYR